MIFTQHQPSLWLKVILYLRKTSTTFPICAFIFRKKKTRHGTTSISSAFILEKNISWTFHLALPDRSSPPKPQVVWICWIWVAWATTAPAGPPQHRCPRFRSCRPRALDVLKGSFDIFQGWIICLRWIFVRIVSF